MLWWKTVRWSVIRRPTHAAADARIPYFRMGETVGSDRQAVVLPDSSWMFCCLGFDGIAGRDLLRGCVVRMPDVASMITLADDVRLLDDFDRGSQVHFAGNSLVIAAHATHDKPRMKTYIKFDIGSASLFDCRYEECLALMETSICRCLAEGHSGNLGWSHRSVAGGRSECDSRVRTCRGNACRNTS